MTEGGRGLSNKSISMVFDFQKILIKVLILV